MDIEAVSDFLALAECRSFSKAAEARAVSQSAFSRRIQALENNLGVILVDRAVTPVGLTPAGERFLVYARNITEIVGKAVDEVQSQLSAMPDPVYVVMPPSLSVTFFPAWYRDLQRRIPDLSLRLSAQSGSRSVMDLRKGLADLAVILVADGVQACFDLEGLQSCTLGVDALRAVKAVHAGDDGNFLGYIKGSYMDSCAQKILDQKTGPKAKTIFESPSAELLKAMALTGFGTAVLQESMIEDELRERFLIPAFDEDSVLNCEILLLRPMGPLNQKAQAVWDCVTAES